MRRRHFLKVIAVGSLGFASPLAAQKRRRIAYLAYSNADDGALFVKSLTDALAPLGYSAASGTDVVAYFAGGRPEQAQKIVAESISAGPDVLICYGPLAFLLQRATSSIPIIFGFSGDPIEAGLVDSIARPGRNATGISFLALELVGKRLELLIAAMPKAKKIAVIASPQHPGDRAERRATESAAARLGLSISFYEANNTDQLVSVLLDISTAKVDAVLMFPVQVTLGERERIARWSIENRIPVISGWSQFAQGGNFMSYGPNLHDVNRRLAQLADQVLRGGNPASMPVEWPSKFELIINQKTAKAIGIDLPQSLLLRADEVIE